MTRLLVTMGDPAGVGPEVLLGSLVRLRSKASITVIGDLSWLKRCARKLHRSIPWDRFEWVDLKNVSNHVRLGQIQTDAGRAAYAYLEEAVRRLQEGRADALVTAPVSKAAIAKAGISWIGHTEYLGKVFRSKTVMMFVTSGLKISLVTTHLSLRELPHRLTREKVAFTLEKTFRFLQSDCRVTHPRIGLAALNPHGGDKGLFGNEEKKILVPALRLCRQRIGASYGQSIEGPLPADSLLQAAARGKYDAVVALYHDQALIPIKLIGWEQAGNVTLGLPFIRTSPVHGTAFDIAGKGKADCRSMLAAMESAIRYVRA